MTDGNGGAAALLSALTARLPGLAGALDSEVSIRRIEEELLRPGGRVRRATPGALWYQPDGSCSLRYRVTVSGGTGQVSEHTVLARVYSSGEVALSLFPADPALPTLPEAMNIAALWDEDRSVGEWPCPTARPTSVDLVHHSRTGPAVLRYGVRRPGSAAPYGHVYGKVYPDSTTGEQVHRFLASFTGRVRIPVSLGYSPRLQLGVTEALPGRPVLPSLVRSAAALEAMRSTGRTLAALHSTARAVVPVRTVRHLYRELDQQLNVVQPVWPKIADQVRSRVQGFDTEPGSAAEVLCHGDFTPAQVLLADNTVCGLVDFDTVCRSEPAMDLGRFLAHLDLLVVKEFGPAAAPMAEQLAEGFLSGYNDALDLSVVEEPFWSRVSLFRALSLASTALHACRQLKQRRADLALALLSAADHNTDHLTGKAAAHEHLV